MKVSREIFYPVLFLLISLPLYSRGEGEEGSAPLKLGASWTGDFVTNLNGGLKRGSCYLGMASLTAQFDTEAARLWKRGSIYVKAANTHGATPSSDLFGDAQVSSNIEAGNHTFIMELWIRQRFGNVEFTAGLQDLNAEFAVSGNGGLYLNSSFGILPVITGNIPAPVFPLTSPGLTMVWDINGSFSLASALFDGRPTEFDYNPYNTNWQINSGDGILAVAELRHVVEIKDSPGEYKVGLYTHNHFIEKKISSSFPDSLHRAINGGYIIADQAVWQSGYRSLSLFLQAGYSPSRDSFTDFSLGFGVNFTGVLSTKGNDTAGLAFTKSRFSNDAGSETALEITYRNQLTENIFIQPDLQYILFPSGRQSRTPHCLAGFFRMVLSF